MSIKHPSILIIFLLYFFSSNAQFWESNTIEEKIEDPLQNEINEDLGLISSKVINCEKFDGLFTIFRDKTNGKMFILISKDQLEKEFIYFSYVENGVTDAGFFKGNYRGSKVFSIKKHFNKIDFFIENTNYFFDEDSPLYKSSHSNINKPFIVSQEIIATNTDGSLFLIDADNIFLTEAFQQIKRYYSSSYRGYKLGKLNKQKTRCINIRNYPKNTDFVVDYYYDKPTPSARTSMATTDSRVINIRLQHSLIEMPDSNFTPRMDDPRIGYFTSKINDMTSIDPLLNSDVIHKWRLEKKYPDSVLSEPVEPIVFWIENTTPHEIRDYIKEGVESWNNAFESAGFKNAIVVNIQPDTAKWDAGDIRYNVLRWTSSPSPPFGGYGPSFVNPKTGEILGADIMLEWIYITKRINYSDIFNYHDDNSIHNEENLLDPNTHDYCFNGMHAHQQNMFASSYFDIENVDSLYQQDLVEQSIKRLVLHEVGHTLGLNHNFKGSTLLNLDETKDINIVLEKGLCNSVMEYPAINISNDIETQTLYYDTVPGIYDHWAIEFAYSVFPDSIEKKELNNILSKSNQPDLAFANDADDMRSPGKGIDPYAMINDLTNEPVKHSVERMDLIYSLMNKLKDKYSIEGESYQRLKNAFSSFIIEYRNCLSTISRQIGGVEINRSFYDPKLEQRPPLKPINYSDQKEAVQFLGEHLFSKDALIFTDSLYSHLQTQRRGFNIPYNGEDPKIMEQILYLQKITLAQLLHNNVLNRINNSYYYGNNYKIDEYFEDLNKLMFQDDLNSSVNYNRQNLQTYYTERLLEIVDNSTYNNIAQSVAYSNLDWIYNNLNVNIGDSSSKKHRKYLIYLINNSLYD